MTVQEAAKGLERQLAIRTWVIGVVGLILAAVGLVRLPFLKMCSQSPISNLTIGHGRTGKPLRTRLQEKRPVFWR